MTECARMWVRAGVGVGADVCGQVDVGVLRFLVSTLHSKVQHQLVEGGAFARRVLVHGSSVYGVLMSVFVTIFVAETDRKSLPLLIVCTRHRARNSKGCQICIHVAPPSGAKTTRVILVYPRMRAPWARHRAQFQPPSCPRFMRLAKLLVFCQYRSPMNTWRPPFRLCT